jgi:hypothetical protein
MLCLFSLSVVSSTDGEDDDDHDDNNNNNDDHDNSGVDDMDALSVVYHDSMTLLVVQ